MRHLSILNVIAVIILVDFLSDFDLSYVFRPYYQFLVRILNIYL